MRKYAVDIIFNWQGCYNAGPKARVDVSRTLKTLGYKIICIKHKDFNSKTIYSLYRKLQIIWLYYRYLRKADRVLFQYPGTISLWLLNKLKKNNTKITILIHDLENIREERDFTEKIAFNYADDIISHTPNMTSFIKKEGISCKIHDIMLFDYYAENSNVIRETDKNSVVFCGNLSKSPFIYSLGNIPLKGNFFLYGKGYNNSITTPNVKYSGTFHSNDISDIKGAWGLVWDGASVESCATTAIGRYLRYNSSHKASLYIVAEKPLIVWRESALAEYVKRNQIGIIVNSLLEIETVIGNITPEEYLDFIKNVKILKEKLTKGVILSQVIKQIEDL